MWSRLRSETGPPASVSSQSALSGQDNRRAEISHAWNSLTQTKAALRHIENRLEAAPGTGVLLDSVLDTKKASVSGSRKISLRDGRHVEESGSKSRTRSRRSPDKSSRSPLRNSTLDSNARKLSAVEFREPLVSYREASPLPVSQAHSEPEVHSLPTEVGVPQADFALSQLVYQRDTRDMQTADLDSPCSSAVDSTSVHYLNDLSALNAIRQPDQAPLGSKVNPRTHLQAETSQTSLTSITGSVTASLRLENLRRRQPDEKLEKLKERIRRQREHLEETEERNKLLGYLEQPVGIGAAAHGATVPTAKVRKVAPAPPAPIYKGFNTSETKIRTSDGKVWAEEDFQNLSREIYKDLTKQLTAESTKPKQRPAEREKVKEKKPSKPVRKVHRSSSAPDSNTKPAISTSSWRDGQKLVKMMLGPPPRLHREPRVKSSETQMRTGPAPRSSSDPRLERSRRSRPTSAERHRHHILPEEPAGPSRLTGGDRRKSPSTDLLSADIRCILDDLQLEEDSSRRAEAPHSKVRASTRVSRSASPAKTTKRADPPEHPMAKKRHYDAEAVRLYIAQKQEERKKRQAEERRAQREEEENKNKRLQELYRRQRAGATKGPVAPEGPIKKRLQETYTKLLLEQTQLREEISGGAITNIVQQPRPVYQPSGESDKENKRHDRPQSATSSSDLSLTGQCQPPFSRNGLGFAGSPWLQSDQRSPVLGVSSSLAPPSGHIFSQLLELDPEPSLPNRESRTAHAAFPSTTSHKMSRIEALKATAASLSSRIESEARKLAGAGINYGCARDTGTGLLIPKDDRWAKPVSPPVRENPTDSDELVERIEKLLAAGQSTYDQALPGVGNLHSFRERMETGNKQTLAPSGLYSRNTHKTPTPPKPIVQEVELDSSGGSISEGPLLSEGSISDEDLQEVPKSRLGTKGYSAHLNGESLNPISRFQKEAEKHLPFNVSSMVRGGSNGPWEELAKGSPHSVINIFTKNMNYSKAFEERGGKSSPALRSALSGASSLDGMVYEDDFVSSRASSQSASKRSLNGLSNGHGRFSPPDEVLSVRSAYSNRAGERSQHSPARTPLSSPHSASSSSKRASERSLLEGQRNTSSAVSDLPAEGFRKSGSEKASSRSSHRSVDTDSTLGGVSVHSIHSHFGSEGKKSPRNARSTPAAGSPASSGSSRLSPDDSIPSRGSAQGSDSPHAALPSSSSSAARAKSNPSAHTQSPGRTEHRTAGSAELQFAPGVLQQRLSAELSYLDAVEESVRQLGDVERVRGVSLAQQETVSLAQILKSQQQRHERELYLLRMKAEQEALETQRQLEESRQKAAQAHAELQEGLLQSQQQALGGLHEATNKMINQQAEAARHTAETAQHIKEMTELARSQIAGALSVPGPSIMPLYDQQKPHKRSLKPQQPYSNTDSSWKSELSPERRKSPSEVETPPDSLSESIPSRRPTISGGGSSSTQRSPPRSDQDERNTPGKDRSSSSVEDQAHTAADDSLCSENLRSPLQEKADSASIAEEYSVKFEDSMTEDDIEERSFRSLLPSEAHRRESLDRKPSPHPESDDDHSHDRSSPRASSKDGSMPFSSGQDSFSRFTMDLVRQYMKEEEVRAQHQSSLLRLRQKALREKTKAELAWLEHQKRHLRDKGEDDKMPPLRKKQRGLILKLQQEQAEIKRLQEANKAARRERQLLLKQQEEIERMRHTTLKLKERLKSADTKLESPVSGEAEESAPPSVTLTDAETRSHSPMSVSGSETSSIMQKLKKMRSHMDEKHCSPVHYFFSVFTAHHWASLSICLPNLHPKFQLFIYSQLVRFLTKREQQLMQRRRHAEELLEWRQRLDAEEAEVRQMEKQALAAWEKQQQPRNRTPLQQRSWESELSKTRGGQQSPTGQEAGSEDDDSQALSVSSLHTDLSVSEQLASPSSDQPVSELPSPHAGNSPAPDTLHSPAFNATDSKQSPPEKVSLSSLRHSDNSQPGTVTGTDRSSKMQVCSNIKTSEACTSDPHSATPSETTSDQSDIESRIRALKDELRKRKSVVYQLKKEQKKRQKERLKAQEASLLKQLESYNDFIQKTKAELSKEPDSTPATKPQIKTPTSATEKPRIKPPPLQRPETSKNWKIVTESEKSETVPTETSADKADDVAPIHQNYSSEHDDISSDEDPPTVTPTPVMGSPEHMDVLRSLRSPEYPSHQSEDAPSIKEHSARAEAIDLLSEDESVVSSHKSGIMEELEYAKSEGSENYQSDQHSHPLLKLDFGLQIPSLNDMKPKFEEERLSENDADEKQAVEDSANAGESMRFTDSPVVKLKDIDYPSAEKTPSAIDHSYTPDFSLSKGEDSPKMKDTQSRSGDGYNDDFEPSFESSFKEDNHESKLTSPSAPEPKEKSVKSPMYSSEEEIEEELSVRSGSTNGSFQTEGHADLSSLGKESDDIMRHSKCLTLPQHQMPVLPVKDELPSFCIGDRVLVSNIQPGTLRFKGQTNFANGFWAGVELDNPEGSNNGTYDGVVYFECREKHGIFAPPDKISRLPEKFEASPDTEDEDSSYDDQPNSKNKGSEEQLEHRNVLNKIKGEKSDLDLHPETREPSEEHGKPLELNIRQLSTGQSTYFKSQHNLDINYIDCNIIKDCDKSQHTVPNGGDRDIILTSVDNVVPLLNNLDKGTSKKQEEEPTAVILDRLVEDKKIPKTTDISIEEASLDNREDLNNKRALTTLADKLVENFLSDAVKQFQKIKKDKEEKLSAANQLKRDFINEDDGLDGSNNFKSQSRSSSKTKKDSFFDDDQEELSSPEHCNRPESPVLGTSGQEELAKRLAELEMSRELFDVLGEEQDWFDEDFGLSSRKQQQKQKQQQDGISGAGEQVKTPPRPELPVQMKQPEEPAMIVPHTVQEVEKLVIAATQEIWKSCKLGHGRPSLTGVPKPQPSNSFLEGDSKANDLEAQCQQSYKLAVFDLSWEVIQDIYAEDPKVDQPQWMKPRRLNSTYFHRVKCPNDITTVQEFVTTEVLKLCGLKKEQNQKTDWQKMIKFGRKKRDRVDHILVQELHEEESQWVNYDEDELFVKMQLADGIFDALLKDTAEVLTQIQGKKSRRTF
ncbi:centrosome-associated protein 350-like isoform X6 [Carassius auratus]|uniref:Centrosome-associated protein 350-like isoform X6 n=1 Tax=Carassius auratus TaxID=7957 RepID=A0A6P6PW21_CARAU|nr:centrosome-associated protein 350-like isoform X6 [Carassius auratus]